MLLHAGVIGIANHAACIANHRTGKPLVTSSVPQQQGRQSRGSVPKYSEGRSKAPKAIRPTLANVAARAPLPNAGKLDIRLPHLPP